MVDLSEEPLSKKRNLDASSESSMDALPVDLVGNILSHMACARWIAVASATCRKWREAARCYIHKLSFNDSEWPVTCELEEQTVWRVRELIIMKKVMQTTCLSELSIDVSGGDDLHLCAVVICLLHTKPTLRSFTLKSPIMPNVNILETLAGVGGVLECLEWAYADIPTLDPRIHCVPSLVSLALEKVSSDLSAENLLLLFSVFPKLENLSISETVIVDAPPTIQLNLCSLQKLTMDCVDLQGSTIVLHDCKLGQVSVKEMEYGVVRWMRREGTRSMQYLRLASVEVLELEAGEDLGHLEVVDVGMPFLEIKGNLQHLTLENLRAHATRVESLVSLRELALGYDVVDKHTYSEVLSKVSSKLRELMVWGGISRLTLEEIAMAYPHLLKLRLEYKNTSYDVSVIQPPLFKEVTRLEVITDLCVGVCKPLAKWILGLLNRFPSLKVISFHVPIAFTEEPDNRCEFIGTLSSLLIEITHLYPHIKVSFWPNA